MIDVCLLGTGGMIPLPERYLTALLLRHNGKSILVDCGEGTQVAIRQYGWALNSIDTICFTHVHGDHVAGISGLLSSIGNEGRTDPIHILGPKYIESVIAQICVVVRVPFDVIFHENDRSVFTSGDIAITPFPAVHNVPCFGYRFDLSRMPKFLPEKARQLGIPVTDWKLLQQGQKVSVDGKTVYPEEVTGPNRPGISLVYSTDTRPNRNLKDAMQGCDLAVIEGIYGDAEKTQSAKDKKHMTAVEAAKLSREAGAKEVWLTHYSPAFRDQDNYREGLQQINPLATFGYDGMKTVLKFSE